MHWAKYTGLYSIAVNFDGAMDTWDQLCNDHPDIARDMFGNDEDWFNQYSPFWNTSEHAAFLRENSHCLQIIGNHGAENKVYSDLLDNLNIPHEYVTTGCGHDFACLLNAQGTKAMSFIAEHLGGPTVQATTPHRSRTSAALKSHAGSAALFDLRGRQVGIRSAAPDVRGVHVAEGQDRALVPVVRSARK